MTFYAFYIHSNKCFKIEIAKNQYEIFVSYSSSQIKANEVNIYFSLLSFTQKLYRVCITDSNFFANFKAVLIVISFYVSGGIYHVLIDLMKVLFRQLCTPSSLKPVL